MCIEDYVTSLNKSLEPQTTLVPTVKHKLDYDIYDTSRKRMNMYFSLKKITICT